MAAGWAFFELGRFGWVVRHSSGFYVAGFESRIEAGVWLQQFLLAQYKQQQRDNLRRDKVLARMIPRGMVS